ncbi:MAG: DUF1778 domain-containing protein [Bifidobacteriaceae bacterium]|nr:DUF1778 domain-containing protein [Bifidobacteriaceae bacterium]
MSESDRRPATREALNLRWRPEDRALIDRAAGAAGLTRTDFVLGAARDRAIETLLDQVYLELAPDAFLAFSEQLDRAPEPNARLEETLRAKAPWEGA